MKKPNDLSETTGIKPHGMPAMLRATVASVLLMGSTAMASEPKKESATTVAMTAKNEPQNSEQFKDEEFRKEMGKIRKAKEVSIQKRLWLRLAKAEPGRVIQYSEKEELPFLMETLSVACETLAEVQPEAFLEDAALNCTDNPNYQTQVVTAAKNASITKPEVAVQFQGLYVGFPEGQKALEGAMDNIRKKTAKAVQKTSSANPQLARQRK